MQHRRTIGTSIIGSVVAAMIFAVFVASPAQSASQWEALTGLDNRVEDIEFGPDGTLYAGGLFTGNVAAWDGATWQVVGSTGPGIGSVTALAVDSAGDLYAAGSSSPFVKVWDGNSWDPLPGGDAPSSGVEALHLMGGVLYAGGGGFLDGSYVARWTGSTWDGLPGGSIGGTVYSLASRSSGTMLAGSDDGNVYALSGITWSALGATAPGVNTIYSIAIGAGDTIYAGGQADPEIVTYNSGTDSWDPVSPSVAEADPSDSNRIYALAASNDGSLYAGGFYSLVTGSQTLEWLGALSSGSWSSPGASFFDDRIRDFAIASDGTLYSAGGFTGKVARLLDSASLGGASGVPEATETLSFDAGQGVTCRQAHATGRQGTWITLPGSSDCTAPSDTPNAMLLGWATTSKFPLDIARRQVANGWGVYETLDASGRITGVFIPAGGSTFLSNSNNLFAVWDS